MRIFLVITWFVTVSCVSQAQTSIVTSAPDHDFGVVKQGDRLSHAFQIWNTGETALHIDKVEMSVSGLTSRFRPEVVPGEAVPITLEWNTTGFSGDVDATAIVYTSDLKQPQVELRLKATVKPPIEFDPFPAFFFTAYQDESPEKHIRIVNNEENPLELGRVEAPANHYIAQLNTIRPGQEFELTMKVRPGVPFGRYTEPIYIETNVSSRPRLQIQANLFVKPELYAFPENIDFGAVRLADLDENPKLLRLLSQTAVVTSRSRPLEVKSVESNLPFLRFAYDETEGPQHKSRVTIDMIRENLKTGRMHGSITIRTSDPLHPVLEIPVSAEIR
jgi:Protein of unknown function (DUF1573)